MTDSKTQFGRLERLEARREAAKLAAPALIVNPDETEAQARERYAARYGYPAPADGAIIYIEVLPDPQER